MTSSAGLGRSLRSGADAARLVAHPAARFAARLLVDLAFALTVLGSSVATAAAQDGITLAGSPSLVVSSAVAGAQPNQATSTGVSYVLTGTSAFANRKVRARLSSSLPAGVTISVQAAVGILNSSSGAVTLSTNYQDILTANLVLGTAYTLTYRMNATSAVDPTLQNVTIQYCVNVSNNC